MLDAEPAQYQETKNYQRFTLRVKREKEQLRFDRYSFDTEHFLDYGARRLALPYNKSTYNKTPAC